MAKNYWVQITKVTNGREQDYKKFDCDTLEQVNTIIDQYSEDDGYFNFYGTNNGSPTLPAGYKLVDIQSL